MIRLSGVPTIISLIIYLLLFTIIYYSHYNLLARVIHVFGIFVCEKQLADFILAIQATLSFFSSLFVLSYGFMGVST